MIQALPRRRTAPAEAPVTVPRSAAFDLDGGALGSYRVLVAWPAEPPPPGGYPVIYHLDGNADFGTFTDSLRSQALRPDLAGLDAGIVVGLGYPGGEPIDFRRRARDYTPAVPPERLGARPNGEPWPPTGGAADFLAFITGTLRPDIARRFPVDPGRQALFGHSFGGLFVLATLLAAPQTFRTYIASSPSLWWGGRILFDRLPDLAARTAGLDLAVQISVGGLEQAAPPGKAALLPDYADWAARNRMIDNARDFHAALAGLEGLDARFHLFEGEHHGSVTPSAISRAVRLAFARRSEP